MYFDCSSNLKKCKNKKLIRLVVFIFEISKLRNIGRSTFGRPKF